MGRESDIIRLVKQIVASSGSVGPAGHKDPPGLLVVLDLRGRKDSKAKLGRKVPAEFRAHRARRVLTVRRVHRDRRVSKAYPATMGPLERRVLRACPAMMAQRGRREYREFKGRPVTTAHKGRRETPVQTGRKVFRASRGRKARRARRSCSRVRWRPMLRPGRT